MPPTTPAKQPSRQSTSAVNPILTQTDLTFANQRVARYFDGLTEDAPVNEMMYLHTHLVNQNFLSQIEAVVLKTSDCLEQRPRMGVINRLTGLSRQYAKLTNNVTRENAGEILSVLRDIYSICKNVLKAEGKWDLS